jgi:Domain of unknown function (DUF5666)
MNYQDALERAFELSGESAALEMFLGSVPSWRADLEEALAVSHSLSRELRAITADEGARLRSQQKLMSTISRLAAAEPDAHASWISRLSSLVTVPRIVVAGVTAAALLAFAVVVDFPSIDGGGTQTAEAVVIEGSVSEVGAGAVTINTSDSARVVMFNSDTVLTDGFGNTVASGRLSAGQDVVLTGSQSGKEFVASQVELRDRLFGVVTALPGDSIHLTSSKGDFVILITPETKFEGVVAVGSFAEIKLVHAPDGSLLALEIEVEREDEDEGEGDDDHGGQLASPSPASSPAPSASPESSSSGPGSAEIGKFEEDKDGDKGEFGDGSGEGGSSPQEQEHEQEGD